MKMFSRHMDVRPNDLGGRPKTFFFPNHLDLGILNYLGRWGRKTPKSVTKMVRNVQKCSNTDQIESFARKNCSNGPFLIFLFLILVQVGV